ncbi:MAG: formylglycine-generating enzyme family protein, partial [Planctomycetota bacterium]
GRSLVASLASMRADLRLLEEQLQEKEEALKPFWPPEKKGEYWKLHDRVVALREEITRTFSKAGRAFQTALEFERANPDARASLADLYWEAYLREEEGGNRSGMILYENLVREYNDGQYDARLKGDGTLSVATRIFPCSCLVEGRPFQSPTLHLIGYHPSSGRALVDRPDAEGLPGLEPKETLTLKMHGPSCKTVSLEGADAWLFRFQEKDKILIPGEPDLPEPSGSQAPGLPSPEVLDRLFEPESPFRPQKGVYLGKTPIVDLSIPMGSYLLILHNPAEPEGAVWAPVRLPVWIGRNAVETLDVTLYGEGEIPEGFVQVPAGRFTYQGDAESPYAGAKEIRETEDFFMGRFPVTCEAYLEYLNDLAGGDPGEAEKSVPRRVATSGALWPRDENHRYAIPTEAWAALAPEPLKSQAGRLEMSPLWWAEDWPVFGVSWEDLMRFASWRTQREGYLFTLAHEVLWEKAARGPDGRLFPWGHWLDATFCNTEASHEEGMRPCPVTAFPIDASPYGVRGLGGNARDLCLNDPGETYPGWRLCRGGAWADTGNLSRSAARTGEMGTNVSYSGGGRLVLLPRLAAPPLAGECGGASDGERGVLS